ncbi:MAG TPA: hypothetical protein VLV86_00735 [Vicinamibacterales bacterium]|nr:hypothetical protein [Vicinamibacterales bacterium]
MARIDWMLGCELAYFERHGRLCMVGVTTELLLPSLPLSMRQMMFVARVTDRAPGEALSVGFAVATPDGQWIAPSKDDDIHIEVVSEYVLLTIRDLPFRQEGVYRFGLHIGEQFAAIDLPVLALSTSRPAEYH